MSPVDQVVKTSAILADFILRCATLNNGKIIVKRNT